MVSVQTIYLLVQDATRKDLQGGYASNDEFNRQLNYAQELLFDYYYDNMNESAARESLIDFQVLSDIVPTTSGIYTRPADYKEKLDASLRVEEEYPPVHFPARDELAMTLSSPVRGPNIDKRVIVGEILSSTINIYPQTGNTLRFRYYKLLTQALRAVTLNVTTQEYEYDPANTIDLEWNEGNLQNFVDVMLLLKGIIIRDSALIQWVQAKENIVAQTTIE